MIAELALATGHLPSQWAEEDPIDIVTTIKMLSDRQQAEAEQQRRREGRRARRVRES